jgi:hypothetical protein
MSQENVELVREIIAAVPDWDEVSALLHPDAGSIRDASRMAASTRAARRVEADYYLDRAAALEAVGLRE